MYAHNKLSWWLYGIGLLIVLGTHIFVLMGNLSIELVPVHSYLNIAAGVLLAAGWLTRKN